MHEPFLMFKPSNWREREAWWARVPDELPFVDQSHPPSMNCKVDNFARLAEVLLKGTVFEHRQGKDLEYCLAAVDTLDQAGRRALHLDYEQMKEFMACIIARMSVIPPCDTLKAYDDSLRACGEAEIARRE
jgi:hypothetical protein